MDESVRKAINEQLTISVELAARAVGISRNAGYAAVKSGDIPSIKIGARLYVPTAPLRRLLGIEDAA